MTCSLFPVSVLLTSYCACAGQSCAGLGGYCGQSCDALATGNDAASDFADIGRRLQDLFILNAECRCCAGQVCSDPNGGICVEEGSSSTGALHPHACAQIVIHKRDLPKNTSPSLLYACQSKRQHICMVYQASTHAVRSSHPTVVQNKLIRDQDTEVAALLGHA